MGYTLALYLASTTEPFLWGGDAAFCQITLTTCIHLRVCPMQLGCFVLYFLITQHCEEDALAEKTCRMFFAVHFIHVLPYTSASSQCTTLWLLRDTATHRSRLEAS